MADKKNNPVIAVILVAALLGAVYLIFAEVTKEEPQSEGLNYTGSTTSGGNIGQASPTDSLLAEDETQNGNSSPGRLPSMQDLPTSVQLSINRIDGNLDRAFQLDYGPKRKKLLEVTEKSLDSLLAMDDNPFYHISTGDLKMLQGDYYESERHYSIALKTLSNIDGLKRNHAGACFNASLAARNENDTDAAIGYLEKFRGYEPDDEEANQLLYSWYKQRAIGLMRKGKTKNGKALLEKALAMNEFDNVIHFNLGIAQYRLLEYDKAIKHFERCLEFDKNDANSKDYLYTIYRIRGDTAMARKYQNEGVDVALPPVTRDK